MAASKDRLAKLLGTAGATPEIRRGQGVRLSTDDGPRAGEGGTDALSQNLINAESHSRISAHAQERTSASMAKRVNRGYALREDLVKALKRVALEEDRTLYDVMEEAMTMYLSHRNE